MRFSKTVNFELSKEERKLLVDTRRFFDNLIDTMEEENIYSINGYDTEDMLSACFRIDALLSEAAPVHLKF